MESCSFGMWSSYSSCIGSSIFLDCTAAVWHYWPSCDLQQCNQIEKPDPSMLKTQRALTSSEFQHIYYSLLGVFWIFTGKGNTIIKNIILDHSRCEFEVCLEQKYHSSPVWSCYLANEVKSIEWKGCVFLFGWLVDFLVLFSFVLFCLFCFSSSIKEIFHQGLFEYMPHWSTQNCRWKHYDEDTLNCTLFYPLPRRQWLVQL